MLFVIGSVMDWLIRIALWLGIAGTFFTASRFTRLWLELVLKPAVF